MKQIAVVYMELLLELTLMFLLGSLFGAVAYFFAPIIHWSLVGLVFATFTFAVKYYRDFES